LPHINTKINAMKKLNIEIKQENTEPAPANQHESVEVKFSSKPASHETAGANTFPKNVQEPAAEPSEKQKHLQQLHENRFNKKGARIAFHLVNFGGLHQIFNNVASVVITFVLATSKSADWMKEKLAENEIGKAISFVLSLPGKVVDGSFKLAGVDLNKGLNALPEAEKAAELRWRAAKSRRSAIEVAFMCIAGFLALAPVWYLENRREGFLNKVDNWLHPNRTPEEREAAALKPGDEPKETWWNLIRARLVALAVVFGIDQVRDNVDSILKHNHISQNKPGMYKNIDTELGWGLGNKLYDKFGEKPRAFLAKLLSGNKVKLSAIQDETREDILKIINAPQEIIAESKKIHELHNEIKLNHGNAGKEHELLAKIEGIESALKKDSKLFAHVERAVFAEQSRMFITKEFFLTTILSIVIYAATKWKPAHNLLSKVGLKKKAHDNDCHEKNYAGEVNAVPSVAVINDTLSPLDSSQKKMDESCDHPPKYSDKSSISKKISQKKPNTSFTEKLASMNEQPVVQLGM